MHMCHINFFFDKVKGLREEFVGTKRWLSTKELNMALLSLKNQWPDVSISQLNTYKGLSILMLLWNVISASMFKSCIWRVQAIG